MSRPPELTPNSRLKVVVLVLENLQGDVLLTQRRKHQHLAGYWEFPGGKIEIGESAIDALQRECTEEIGYHTTATKHIFKIHHDYPSISVELLVFHEINSKPLVNPAENQRMQWVNKSKLSQFKLPEANKSIVQYLNEKLMQH